MPSYLFILIMSFLYFYMGDFAQIFSILQRIINSLEGYYQFLKAQMLPCYATDCLLLRQTLRKAMFIWRQEEISYVLTEIFQGKSHSENTIFSSTCKGA